MTNTIAIRNKVAELCGYKLIYETKTEVFGYCLNPLDRIQVPHYELSLDAITKAFDDHNLTYTLSKRVSEDTNKVLGYFAISGLHNAFSDTAAKAMCYLFIHCMEEK